MRYEAEQSEQKNESCHFHLQYSNHRTSSYDLLIHNHGNVFLCFCFY